MCDCIKLTNEALEKRTDNTKLDLPILFNLKGTLNASERTLVATTKRDEHKRKRPAKLFASFCPFCGEKYPED